jgi:prepilin peptidase CpaA
LYTIWIDATAIAISTIAALVAAIVDYRTSRIPNALTLPAIAAGLMLMIVRCALGYSPLWALATCVISYAIAYGLWKGGLWGGGDAKLVIAMLLLISPVYAPFVFMAAFLACLALALFLRHYVLGALSSNPGLAAYALLPLLLSLLVLAASWGLSHAVAIFLAVAAFAIAADLVSDAFPYTERVGVGYAAGRRLAEEIHVTDGGVRRAILPASLIRGSFRAKGAVLGREDVRILRRYVSYVDVYVQRPMGPSLLVAYAIALALPFALGALL